MKSNFLRKFAKVFSGTLVAQLITIASITILSRLYEVEDFADFEIVASTAMILGGILALRFEFAIVHPRYHRLAANVYVLALGLAIGASAIIGLLVLFASLFFDQASLILWAVLAGFGQSLIGVSGMWFARLEKFGTVSVMRILRSIAVFLIQVSLFYWSKEGLYQGYALGFLAIGILSVLYSFRRNVLTHFRMKYVGLMFRRWLKFSLWSIPSAAINNLANAIPAYAIGLLYSEQALGYFSMLRRAVQSPIVLISGSVNKVVYQEFTKLIGEGRSVLRKFKQIVKGMSLLTVVVYFAVVLFIELGGIDLFLGPKWAPLSYLYYLMTPSIVVGFISRSVARFAIYERTDIGFYFQSLLLLSVLSSFVVASLTSMRFEACLLLMSSVQAVIYLVQLFISYKLACKT